MVKTRQQQAALEKRQSSINNECGVQTRARAQKLQRVELPAIVLSKEMTKRHKIKKAIAKQSKQVQTDKKIKKLINYSKRFKAHQKQTNDEMLAVWKNLESAFQLIDGLCKFRNRVEGKC